MIDYLRGKAVHLETDYIVVDVQGVGYRVFCANPYTYQSKSDTEVTIYIHYHVREDAILLFGFQTREEQTLFRRLLDVSGIGPRVALGILSGGRPEAVVAAIQQENLVFLTKLPGIGKKTAQRMILDLKDKLSAIAGGHWEAARAPGADDPAFGTPSPAGNAWIEVKQGLMGLGYTEAEADQAWQAIKSRVKESDTADTIMKLALQALFKG